MASRDYFKGKRVAVIGVGPHGEMVEDIKYLIKAGAWVSIYDLKSEARLKNHLVFLRSVGLANYVCGSIPPEDLLDVDLIILSHGYPRESSFLKEVYAQNKQREAAGDQGKIIPIEYPETLFFKLAPPVTLVGVMGVCGKSTVISLMKPMLEDVCKTYDTQNVYSIDAGSAGGVLAHLRKMMSGDIVIMRIVDEMIPELFEMRISPHVAIFTSVPTTRGRMESPFQVLAYQTYNNFLVAADEVIDLIRNAPIQQRAKMLRTKSSLVPDAWGFEGRGAHDRLNAALALQAARLFKVDDDMAHRALSEWKALKGRLELVKKVKGVEFYNDTASMVPESTLAGMSALAQGRNLILIFGGVDGGYEYRPLYNQLPRYVHTVIDIPGSGTIRERAQLHGIEGVNIRSVPSIDEAVRTAFDCAQKGDRVLFSPGFDAGGMEGSRWDRGERFVKAVRAL